MTTFKAIVINPHIRTIEEVHLPIEQNDAGYKAMKATIGYAPLTTIRLDRDNVMFLDDEGMYRDHQVYFRISTYDQWLAGKAVIVGTEDDGETASTTLSLASIERLVEWPEVQPKFLGVETTTQEGVEIMPGITGTRITNKTVFE